MHYAEQGWTLQVRAVCCVEGKAIFVLRRQCFRALTVQRGTAVPSCCCESSPTWHCEVVAVVAVCSPRMHAHLCAWGGVVMDGQV